jgi:two-component system, sensor histidine kinase and response regulator
VSSAREILSELLRGLGFQVQVAPTGEAALEAVRAADAALPYGVLFLDWKMPGLNGIETAERLREEGALRNPPRIVMVSGAGPEGLRKDATRAGIEVFLEKPVSQSTLLDTLLAMFAPPAGAPVQDGAADGAPDLGGLRLLLAEDNEINRQIAVELLEGAGATVEAAENGRIAVDKLSAAGAAGYDAVLMDLQMPEMDGMEATRRIRADPRFAGVPIIAMTAHAMAEERERCLAAGMVDHIAKPIDPPAMFATLLRHVKPKGGGGRGPAVAAGKTTLPAFEGLDTAAGLRRVGGNRKLYLSLLRQFVERQANAAAQVATADPATAERIAHTVKGVAGNLGLTSLAPVAGTLEAALRSGQGMKSALSAFEAEMARTVASLQEALGAEAAPAAASAAPDLDALRRLAALLAASDGDAADFFREHEAGIRPLFEGGDFRGFEQAVSGYDFEVALGRLQACAAGRGIKLGEKPA